MADSAPAEPPPHFPRNPSIGTWRSFVLLQQRAPTPELADALAKYEEPWRSDDEVHAALLAAAPECVYCKGTGHGIPDVDEAVPGRGMYAPVAGCTHMLCGACLAIATTTRCALCNMAWGTPWTCIRTPDGDIIGPMTGGVIPVKNTQIEIMGKDGTTVTVIYNHKRRPSATVPSWAKKVVERFGVRRAFKPMRQRIERNIRVAYRQLDGMSHKVRIRTSASVAAVAVMSSTNSEGRVTLFADDLPKINGEIKNGWIKLPVDVTHSTWPEEKIAQAFTLLFRTGDPNERSFMYDGGTIPE